jgi:hypothetical protein
MNALLQLPTHGQSYWLDDLTREMIANGGLAERVTSEGLGGVTSNPSIFAKALKGGDRYSAAERAAHGETPQQIYEGLVTGDVCAACDVLQPVYERAQGLDGYANLEGSPHLAHDTRASIEEARRLWKRLDRPNLFIKIPGTVEGIPAIEELLFEGININITLLFSVARYETVAESYLRALERRLCGRPAARSRCLRRQLLLEPHRCARRRAPRRADRAEQERRWRGRPERATGKAGGAAASAGAAQSTSVTERRGGGTLEIGDRFGESDASPNRRESGVRTARD